MIFDFKSSVSEIIINNIFACSDHTVPSHCHPGEADSHRYGHFNDSCSVSWPGPPRLQQHVRLSILSVGVLTDGPVQMSIDPHHVLTFSPQHCCQWTVKLVQHGESSGMKTPSFRLSCCSWLGGSGRRGKDLSYQGKFRVVKKKKTSIHHSSSVIHLSGTKSMPAQSWQCATMTYLRWRTITVLWPSRSFLFLSAISLQMWILRHSNRSDRWNVQLKP